MNILATSDGLDEFLEILRAKGFPVGLDHRLRLLQALDAWQGCFPPQRLRTLLCPIFATNAEEQHLFYRLFDNHFPRFSLLASADKVDETSSGEGRPDRENRISSSSTTSLGRISRRRLVVAVLSLFALAALTISVWYFAARHHNIVPDEAGGKASNNPPPPIPTPEVRPTPVVPPAGLWQPTFSAQPFTKPIPPSNSWRWSVLLLLPPLLWVLAELWAWHRRRAILSRGPGKDLSGSAQRSTVRPVRPTKDGFPATLRRLRRPTAGPVRLHLSRTISATIRAAGFPEFRYEPVFRRPEYLILIDRASVRDHQATFFEELVDALEHHGVRLAAYSFSGDPRVCINISTGRSVYLADLSYRTADHRLIVFGEGDRLASERGDPTAGATVLLRWRQRAILTPRQPNRWGRREWYLARNFLLLPATTESLAASVDYFDPDHSARLLHPASRFDFREPDLDRASAAEIRRSLGDDALYTWLCACALYPQLQWDVTLRLGSMLEPSLLSELNIEKLFRLPWFRRGSFPVRLQQALAESLDKTARQRLRRVILEILAETTLASDGLSSDVHRLEIAVQRLDMLPDERRRILDDEAVARVVAGHNIPPLALLIPSALRKVLFPFGVPALGFRARMRRAFLFLGLLAVTTIAGSAWYSSTFRPTDQIALIIIPPPPPPSCYSSTDAGPVCSSVNQSASIESATNNLYGLLFAARVPAVGQPLIENQQVVCGPKGDATDQRRQALNDNKNRADQPTAYQEISWDQLKNLPKDRANDFQGAAVSVVGFLSHPVKVESGGSGESANCHLTGASEVDWHMYLNLRSQSISQAIIVETTPRVRPFHKWTTDMLDRLANSEAPVRISGWLMYDFEQENAIGLSRATAWEIHPITRIEVIKSGQWVDLDSPPNQQSVDEARMQASMQLGTLFRHAESLEAKRDYAGAEPLYRQALAIGEKAFGPNDQRVVVLLDRLAELCGNQGKYEEGELLYRRALAIEEKALGPDDSHVAVLLDHLASLYSAQGKYREAEPLYQRALAIDEKALPEHQDVAILLDDLAEMYRTQGRYEEAEPLYRRALAIDENAVGPAHPNVATDLNHLAALLEGKKDYAGAEMLYRQALAIDEKASGPEGPSAATDLNHLASLLQRKGDYAGAEPLYRRALEINEKLRGLGNPDTADSADSLVFLGKLLCATKRCNEGKPLLLRALKAYRKVFGAESPRTRELAKSIESSKD